MALKGRALLAIWHIEPAAESEYSDWHTRQHMPKRLGIPGFLVGRRAVNWELSHQRWFTLYETRTLEVLSSDVYRVRLNNPANLNRLAADFRDKKVLADLKSAGHEVDLSAMRKWLATVDAGNKSAELEALKRARHRAIAHTATPNKPYKGKARIAAYGDDARC